LAKLKGNPIKLDFSLLYNFSFSVVKQGYFKKQICYLFYIKYSFLTERFSEWELGGFDSASKLVNQWQIYKIKCALNFRKIVADL
jgi:hypothetical protein